MFPSIVADVSYDASLKTWRVAGRGVIPATLDLTDPQAKDDEIISELYMSPMVYRAGIRRPLSGGPHDDDPTGQPRLAGLAKVRLLEWLSVPARTRGGR
jgi:hypothetical protein